MLSALVCWQQISQRVPGVGHPVPVRMDCSFPTSPSQNHGVEQHGSSAGRAHGQQEEVAAATRTRKFPFASRTALVPVSLIFLKMRQIFNLSCSQQTSDSAAVAMTCSPGGSNSTIVAIRTLIPSASI
uniref:Uncharacterized protein n=1 Tax=Zonotrichia albicollis TaxID=44394 RepID=A0A8D2MNJ5_ZONAL